jgi:glycosyltransferase involved in cell wall biosynthesis
VIIPTFNRGYIPGETIASVVSQTYRHLERIVVDDGSTDNTAALVAGFGHKTSYLRQPNSGVTAARNLRFTLSHGEFVALLDSDDTCLSWKVEAQITILRAFPEVGMVWSNMEAVNRNGRSLNQRYLRRFYHAHQSPCRHLYDRTIRMRK